MRQRRVRRISIGGRRMARFGYPLDEEGMKVVRREWLNDELGARRSSRHPTLVSRAV